MMRHVQAGQVAELLWQEAKKNGAGNLYGVAQTQNYGKEWQKEAMGDTEATRMEEAI